MRWDQCLYPRLLDGWLGGKSVVFSVGLVGSQLDQICRTMMLRYDCYVCICHSAVTVTGIYARKHPSTSSLSDLLYRVV